MKLITVLLLFWGSLSLALDVSEFEKLAIQDGGRLKPFDTFARESSQLITGRAFFKGKNPTELVLAWLFLPETWFDQPIIQIKHFKLKQDLGYAEDLNFLTPKQVMENAKLGALSAELAQLIKEEKKLDPYFTAVQRINNQIGLFRGIVSGHAVRLIPQKLSSRWLSLAELQPSDREEFKKVATAYFAAIAKGDQAGFDSAVTNFKLHAQSQASELYLSDRDLKIELSYNKLHLFRFSYVFYLMATIIFLLFLHFKKPALRSLGLGLVALGLTAHTAGFVMRCWIAGRPPVSNMYESVIWVAFGCVVFGIILEALYKKTYVMLAATSMATIALIVGDSAPAVLDQSIRPLEAVLRSNYWLTVHVLTITLSYAAFALATGIGNITLSYYVRGIHNKNKDKIQSLNLFLYRSMQIGVLLLTAGTILGGVWADASWGRFWGWDPKETWALIADLGYLAVLHGRFSGILRNFGVAAASVCCFAGIIMAWYGVNFVLGEGKHSYGFGGGGVQYVAAALALQLLYVGVAARRYKNSNT